MKTDFESLRKLCSSVNRNPYVTKYYKSLPKELEKWYVCTFDGGHNIFVFPKQFDDVLKSNPKYSYSDCIIPCPVKTVLRGYIVNDDGIIEIEGLQYNIQSGLIFPEDDIEYPSEIRVCEAENPNSISILYSGKEVFKTNYFDSGFNHKGLFYLSYHEKCFQLFIPSLFMDRIDEIKSAKYAVITLGEDKSFRKAGIEILFEDFTRNPFSIQISLNQLRYPFDKTLDGSRLELKGYCKEGLAFNMNVYVRSAFNYSLPYLKPIKTANFK